MTARNDSPLARKALPSPKRRDEDAGDRRPDEPRAVEDRLDESHRLGNLVAAHELRREGLGGRQIEGGDETEQRRDREDVPERDPAREQEPARMNARNIIPTCVTMRIRRFSKRSASVSADHRQEQDRRVLATLSAPSTEADCDSPVTSQPWAMTCIQVPVSDTA